MGKFFLVAGAGIAGMAVMLGALGSHALKKRLDGSLLETFNTAVQYQMYHAVALLLVGCMIYLFPGSSLFRYAGLLFLIGILLFSGSLYGLVLTPFKLFGPITPLGGFAFIAGWVLLAYGSYKAI